MASSSETSLYTLRVDPKVAPADALRVVSFEGSEAISRLYSFDVTVAVAAADESAVAAGVLGRRASFVMRHGEGKARFVHGIVGALSVLGPGAMGRALLRVRLVPSLWLAKHRRGSRIFQGRRVTDIVDAVLGEAGIPRRFELEKTYLVRDYVTQYDETDLDFVRRLLAEEGLFFTFEQPALAEGEGDLPGETLVIGDDPARLPDLGEGDAGALHHRDAEGFVDPGLEVIHSFSQRRAVRTQTAVDRDWDPTRPNLDLTARAAASEGDGRLVTAPAGQLEVYDHRGDWHRADVVAASTEIHLEQLRRRAVVSRGESHCRALTPGVRFRLEDHPVVTQNRAYVVTRVRHRGRIAAAASSGEPLYENRFECGFAETVPRPRRPARRVVQTLETALVVGDPGQEICVDAHGRVKVQFHWDREGKRNQNSSCWIRVAQAWSGASWGSVFIPRVGMEVLVGFLGGDTDKPVVTGCLYNTASPTPFPLPTAMAKTGLRTRSTPGGGGYHELSFDDAKGAEQILLRSQRDLIHDAQRDLSVSAGQHHRLKVGGNEEHKVGRNLVHEVGGDAADTVHGNRADTTRGNHVEQIGGGATLRTEGNRSASIGKNDLLTVTGDYGVVVGDAGADEKNTFNVFVHGDHIVGASGAVRIKAPKGITLECGDSSVTIGPKGIEIKGKVVTVAGSESTSLSGKGPSMKLGDKAEVHANEIRFFAKDAWLKLDKNVAMKGELAKINCDDDQPSTGDDDATPPEMVPFKMKLTDAAFAPYAGKKYQLLADGLTLEGTTDGQGNVDKQIPKDAKAITVVAWIGDYPTGEKRTWSLRGMAMPPETTLEGAQLRLQNLGYYSGDPSKQLDQATKGALASFQTDQGLPVTAKLDAATAAKIKAAHGQ